MTRRKTPVSSSLHALAHPARFFRLFDPVVPCLTVVMVALFGVGLYRALLASPPDYQQGEAVRIMYVHVPAAWMGMMIYGFMGVMAAAAYVWRHPLADILIRAAAPVGATMTALAIVTGMLWGKPMWGTAWVWDARLTSVLVLLILYGGYMALVRSFDSEARGQRAGRVLVLVGVINLPVIKFSVTWWNTLHQPASVMRLAKPALDAAMLTPLLLMAGAYFCFGVVTILLNTRAEVARQKRRQRQRQYWKTLNTEEGLPRL